MGLCNQEPLRRGTSRQNVTVNITSDIVDEPLLQTIQIDLTGGSEENATLDGTANTFTASIQDDDLAPYIYFNNSNTTEANESAAGVTDQVLLTVTMTDTDEQSVVIPYELGSGTAETDVDFILTDHSIADGLAITIRKENGLTSTTIQLDIIGDNTYETNETVVVNLRAEEVDSHLSLALHFNISYLHDY